jgi:hypothetical protein
MPSQPESLVESGKKPLLKEAERVATSAILAGFTPRETLIERVIDTILDNSTDKNDDHLSTADQDARRIVTRLWDEQLHKQEGWPDETDADRIERAFAALEKKNILTRMNFTCCNTCGSAEIGGDRQEEDRGYAFFHEQSMETAISNGELYINFGSFSRSVTRDVEVGKTIVRALKKAGLTVKWNNDPDTKIKVESVRWLRRLPLDEVDE